MYVELIPEAGRFYKVNMHCHTDISDGKQTPEQVKECYKKAGYDAVCYTDHEVLVGHKDLCDADFIALHGYEIAIKQDETRHTAYFMPVYHFNMIARSQDNLVMPNFYKSNPSCPGNSRKWMDEYAQYSGTINSISYDKAWINQYLAGVKAGGFLINYNHPQWSLHNLSDYIGLENLHSIEVINGGCARLNDNTALHFEQMLRAGMRVVPTGGDDNHSTQDCFAGWTMIKAEELTYDALIKGYENGHCYASEGPEIHSLTIRDGKIMIKTSPASAITVLGEGRFARGVYSRTETYTEASFDYCPEIMGKYFRIEVRDPAGYRAFSNAYDTEEISAKI